MTSESPSVERKASLVHTEQYKVKLPTGLKPILADLVRQAIRKQPKNLVVFFADYFSRKLEERARDIGPNEFQTYLGPDEPDHEGKRHRKRKNRRKLPGGKDMADTPSYEDYDATEENGRPRRRNNCECPYPETTSKSQPKQRNSVGNNNPDEWKEAWQERRRVEKVEPPHPTGRTPAVRPAVRDSLTNVKRSFNPEVPRTKSLIKTPSNSAFRNSVLDASNRKRDSGRPLPTIKEGIYAPSELSEDSTAD